MRHHPYLSSQIPPLVPLCTTIHTHKTTPCRIPLTIAQSLTYLHIPNPRPPSLVTPAESGDRTLRSLGPTINPTADGLLAKRRKRRWRLLNFFFVSRSVSRPAFWSDADAGAHVYSWSFRHPRVTLKVSTLTTRNLPLSLRMILRGRLRLHDTVSWRNCTRVVLSPNRPVVPSTTTPLSKFCLCVAPINLHRMKYL